MLLQPPPSCSPLQVEHVGDDEVVVVRLAPGAAGTPERAGSSARGCAASDPAAAGRRAT